MTFSRCLRGARVRHPRTATRVATAALAVSAVLTAVFGAMGAAPAAFASSDRSHPHASAPAVHPGWVKYYIVQPPKNGSKEFLYEIAVKTLHNGDLAMTIFNLNKGRLQPGGGRLVDPTVIDPGWILLLPATASGVGVHYGPLPVVTPPPPPTPTASPAASPTPSAHRTSRAAAGGAGAPRSRGPHVSTLIVLLGAILIALLVAASLIVVLRRRRPAGATRQPGRAEATAPPAPELAAPPDSQGLAVGPAAGAMPAAADTDTDTGGDLAWPDYLTPGISHRAGPERLDRNAPPAPALPQGAWPDDAPPQATPPGDALPQGAWPEDPAAGSAAPAAFSPASLGPLGAAEPPTQPAGTAGAVTQEHEVAFGDDLIHVVLAEAPDAGHGGGPRNGHGRPAAAPYLIWTPLPYDTPDGGIAFACLGAGNEGCLFIDLAAAPGAVAIGGDPEVSVRLAESIMHQLCTAEAADRTCRVVVIGDAFPEPLPSGAAWVASLRELGAAPTGPDDGTEVVFCQLHSNEDSFALERYVSSARRRVIPVVLASLPGAPWSFTAQPSRHGSDALHSMIA